MILKIKPLSINEAWQGRRYKTRKYLAYEKECLLKMKALTIPEGKLEVHYTFGFSSVASDIDNPIKAIQDILQKKYNFNDSRIYRMVVEKVVVKKGDEFIKIEINTYEKK